MAKIPDGLIRDIRNYLDETQGVTNEDTIKHIKFVYAIDLIVEWEDKCYV